MKKYIFFFLLSIIIFFLSKEIGTFWDNVLFVSKMGNHLFSESIFHLHIPPEFDPGHPPFIAWWQSFNWHIFGHHLWVTHLAMIPFQIGLMAQLFILIRRFFPGSINPWIIFFWIMLDPTLLAQFVLVSPEVIQLFFLFLAINGILSHKKWQLALGLALLGLVSYRGMMMCAGVFLFHLGYLILHKKDQNESKSILDSLKDIPVSSYLLGAIPAILFIVWHKMSAGWIYSHPNSPWLETSAFVDFKGFFRNIVILIRNYFDFGRVAIFILFFVFILKNKRLLKDKNVQILLWGAFATTFIILLVSLILSNPIAHRYFIASYLFLHILSAYILITFFSQWKKVLIPIVMISLISGNLWIYPEKIAQGWDASLAGMPYFSLRENMIDYLNEKEVALNEVASFFPNIVPVDYVDFNGQEESFVHFSGVEEYVFYSNVFNLSDADYEKLERLYSPINTIKKYRIEVVLLRKNGEVD